MELDPNVRSDSVEKRRGPTSVPGAESEEKDSQITDSGLSSIEKSKAVKPELVPPMSSPILMAPSNVDSIAFAVASVDTSGRPFVNTVRTFILKGEEIKNSMLEGWLKNIREQEEYVRQLLSSPLYMQLQEIRQKGDPKLGVVSGVESATSANASAQKESVDLLSALNRWQAMERIPPTAEVPDPSAPQDSSKVLILPLTAALLAGGLVVGNEIANAATHPLGGVFEIVERLQPIFPQVSVQDLIPLINLMAVGPIYFNSWNEAISNIKNRERHNYVQTAHKFAKDVIKIVTDPDFVKTLISRMQGTERLAPQDQDRLARMLKVVLIGVALSLLYSVEVGKVQDGKFGGITPEELRSLLLGDWYEPDPSKKSTPHEQLAWSLIQRAHEQLEPLSLEDRTQAATMLIDYVDKTRDFNPMTEPVKIFDETFSAFDPKEKINMFKA